MSMVADAIASVVVASATVACVMLVLLLILPLLRSAVWSKQHSLGLKVPFVPPCLAGLQGYR